MHLLKKARDLGRGETMIMVSPLSIELHQLGRNELAKMTARGLRRYARCIG
jgi:hypothetical protein